MTSIIKQVIDVRIEYFPRGTAPMTETDIRGALPSSSEFVVKSVKIENKHKKLVKVVAPVGERRKIADEVANELREKGYKVSLAVRKSKDGGRIYFKVNGEHKDLPRRGVIEVVRKRFKGAYVTSGGMYNVTIVDQGDLSEESARMIYGD